jgi:hypothetical protein
MTDQARVLVVANETLVGQELVDAVKRRAAKGPVRVTVVAPVNEPAAGYVVYEDSRRAAAGRRLDRTLTALREAGVPAHGSVFESDPLSAVKDILAQEHYDELIVSTHPETKSGWLRRDLVEEIRRVAAPRPVEHVVSTTTAQATANVLVVANETVIGEPLLESDPTRSAHPDAERRLRQALSTLQSEGIEAHGQIAHPDPFTAAMESIRDERTDEVIVSTFPGERSGWLRRDLVGRLRAESGLPVEHVVVEPAEVGASA